MSECPRCREAIKQEATKCPHCGADLVARGAVPGDVILIVDRGLVHFGKFAVGLFGLFFIFGVVLFGLDIKNLVKEMEKRRAELLEASLALKESSTQSEENFKFLKQQVKQSRDEVEKLKSNMIFAEAALRRIQDAEQQANVAVSNITNLTVENIKEIEARTKAGDAGQLLARRNPKLFAPGQKIPVAFLQDASPEVKAVIEAAYTEWEKYVNLDFHFTDDPSEAIIRIGFDPNGSWSYLGRDALKVPANTATMNFGWDITRPDQINTVLSEFGHAIGFPNEISNPREGIVWNQTAVYKQYSNPPFNWTRDLIDSNILRKLPFDEYPCSRTFDKNSIMMDAITEGLTADGEALIPIPGLSDSDKKCGNEMYP